MILLVVRDKHRQYTPNMLQVRSLHSSIEMLMINITCIGLLFTLLFEPVHDSTRTDAITIGIEAMVPKQDVAVKMSRESAI